MRSFWMILAFLSVTLALQPRAEAQKPTQVRVAMHCTCDDAMGQAYFAAVKSLLEKNSEFKQIAFDRANDEGVLSINVVSMPMDNGDGKPRAVLSIVASHDGSIMHQFVETCDNIPLEECAKNMVAGLRDVL